MAIIATSSITDGIIFSMIAFVTLCGLFGFIFYHRYLFNLEIIFYNFPKFKV
jgi:hypothetical protein